MTETKETKPGAVPDVAGILAIASGLMVVIGLIVGFAKRGNVCGSVLGGGTGGSGYTSIDFDACQVRLLPAQQWTELLLYGGLLTMLAAAVVFGLRPRTG